MARRPWLRSIVVVATMVLPVAGCAGLGGAATSAPPPTPTPRPALPAGAYTSTTFKPPLTVTLPDRWVIAGDSAEQFALQPAETDVLGIYAFRSPLAASQDPACPIAAEPGVGTSAAELVAWIQSLPGLVVGDPVAVKVGGLPGQQIDVAIADGWKQSCPFANGLPTVPLFVSGTDPTFRWVVAGQERLRLNLADVPSGGTVVVDIDDFDGTLIGDFLREATPIVASMRFGLP